MAKHSDEGMSDLASEQAFQVLIDQARIRVAMPRLLSKALRLDPDLARRAIDDWADHTRPLSDIADDLRRAVGEE
jgi:hypothetical protein